MTTDGTNAIVRIPLTAYVNDLNERTDYWYDHLYAVKHAVGAGFRVRARADYTGAPDREVTVGHAVEIAREDPSLVYVTNWMGP